MDDDRWGWGGGGELIAMRIGVLDHNHNNMKEEKNTEPT